VIEIRYLRKEYDETVALDNLHLDVPTGEVFGLLGPNGAGKTTLIRILATLLEPTFGQVRIAGIDALEDPVRVRPLIGYMSDFFNVYGQMLVWEYLDYFARCFRIDRRKRSALVDEMLELVSLKVKRDAKVKTLSRGMRQRLCFARTLLNEPKVLLLDEPASGLDPAGRIEFREMLKQLQGMGCTVLISSHILTEMADLCTSIAILEGGRRLACGKVEDIRRRLQPALGLEIRVLNGMPRLVELLRQLPAVDGIETEDGRLRCRWQAAQEELPALHRRIVESGVDLVTLSLRADNLEDIYMKISGHQTS
jgi:ABC-2 type transport system ATP-binding protein